MFNADITVLDLIVMAVFFLTMVGIGYFSTYLIRDTRDYFTGSGKMPWWLLGVSHHVSGYSAVAFTAYAAIAYKDGLTIYFWWAVPIAFSCFFGIFFIVSRWARLRMKYNIESPMEFISTRYNIPTQQVLAWWGVLLKVIDVGAKWVAVALVMITFMPTMPFWVAVFLAVGLGLFYSTLGGLWAGTLTDFAMFLVQFVAGIAMFVIVCLKLGGLDAIWTMWDKLPAGHTDMMAGEYGNWPFIIGMTLVCILGYNGGTWNLAQRYIAAPRGSDAKKAAILTAALYLIWPLVLFFPMWAAPLLLPNLPADQLEQSFSMLVIKFLPPGLTGLMLAALISHTLTMTTADATAITSVLVRDVVPRVWKKSATFNKSQSLFLARAITFIFMLMTAGIALEYQRFGGILGLILGWFSALLGPVSIPMILGLLPGFRRCGVWAAMLSIFGGIITFVITKTGTLPYTQMLESVGLTLTHPFFQIEKFSAGTVILYPTLVALAIYIGMGILSWIFRIPTKKESDDMLNAISTESPEEVTTEA